MWVIFLTMIMNIDNPIRKYNIGDIKICRHIKWQNFIYCYKQFLNIVTTKSSFSHYRKLVTRL